MYNGQLSTYPRRRIPAFIQHGIKASVCVSGPIIPELEIHWHSGTAPGTRGIRLIEVYLQALTGQQQLCGSSEQVDSENKTSKF